MNRSAIQQWTESFAEALVRRATQLGASQRDETGKHSREILGRLQSAALLFESLHFGGPDLSWGRAREDDVAALPRPPVSSGRLVCVPFSINHHPDLPEAWDYCAGVALVHDEDEAAAISFGRGRRTLSVSRSESEARIGFGGDMPLIDDVPGLDTLAPPAQRVLHPFWAMARCILSVDGYGTCFLEGHRVAARGMSPEANIISVFRRELGLSIENEYGESSWHDHVYCALAWTPDAMERWRRLRDPAVRASAGDACPLCKGRLEDADLREPAFSAKSSIAPGSMVRLRCANCTTIFRTARRRTAEFEAAPMASIQKSL
ncbi:hypothetical protein [Hyalangium versicolor]|uniref:hypothetical protein n=1 Tax=Hyalangium versicolor TaxID=2861190 RepID=UPI001CCEF9A5|nr:hypothetical protein [Hyalangium versicolor]